MTDFDPLFTYEHMLEQSKTTTSLMLGRARTMVEDHFPELNIHQKMPVILACLHLQWKDFEFSAQHHKVDGPRMEVEYARLNLERQRLEATE